MGEMEAGFAKLQGEDFEYYMQTYSIVLGRNSKKSTVDVDLAGLGGGMNVSRQHAKISYDFERRRFVLEVLGKNGCYVEGVLHMPGNGSPPVKLDSQDLLQIGEKRFYFLLPAKQIARSVAAAPVSSPSNPRKRAGGAGRTALVLGTGGANPQQPLPPPPQQPGAKKGRKNGPSAGRKQPWMVEPSPPPPQGSSTRVQQQQQQQQTQQNQQQHREGYRYEEEGGDRQQDQHEQEEIVRIILEKLQSQNHLGEWMAVSKLHADILDHFQSRSMSPQFMQIMGVDEDGNEVEGGKGNGRAWSGLVTLLKHYNRNFVINTKLKGGIRVEYVSLYPEEQ